jgi:hypothetical protein
MRLGQNRTTPATAQMEAHVAVIRKSADPSTSEHCLLASRAQISAPEAVRNQQPRKENVDDQQETAAQCVPRTCGQSSSCSEESARAARLTSARIDDLSSTKSLLVLFLIIIYDFFQMKIMNRYERWRVYSE